MRGPGTRDRVASLLRDHRAGYRWDNGLDLSCRSRRRAGHARRRCRLQLRRSRHRAEWFSRRVDRRQRRIVIVRWNLVRWNGVEWNFVGRNLVQRRGHDPAREPTGRPARGLSGRPRARPRRGSGRGRVVAHHRRRNGHPRELHRRRVRGRGREGRRHHLRLRPRSGDDRPHRRRRRSSTTRERSSSSTAATR